MVPVNNPCPVANKPVPRCRKARGIEQQPALQRPVKNAVFRLYDVQLAMPRIRDMADIYIRRPDRTDFSSPLSAH